MRTRGRNARKKVSLDGLQFRSGGRVDGALGWSAAVSEVVALQELVDEGAADLDALSVWWDQVGPGVSERGGEGGGGARAGGRVGAGVGAAQSVASGPTHLRADAFARPSSTPCAQFAAKQRAAVARSVKRELAAACSVTGSSRRRAAERASLLHWAANFCAAI